MEDAQELAIMESTKGPGLEYTPIETKSGTNDRDRGDLTRLGKKPVLKRNFGFMSILGFSCTVLITWEGSLVTFLDGLENGGPAGVIYGYLAVWLGTMAVFASLSELASMAPTSGGQYHWVSMLAPTSSQKFLSYITGLLTVCGWQASVASAGYLSGTMIQGLIALTDSSYTSHSWHGMLLYWAAIFFAVFINTVISSLLPKFEGLILILHILGFFAILLPLLIFSSPHNSAGEVFTSFLNGGGWPTQGLSFFVGITGSVFAFVGADSAVHMSEEIQNASIVVPRSIMLSIVLNGTLGFGMILATLFCLDMTNISAVLDTDTGYPFMEIFLQATNSTAGAATMASIITVLGLCSAVGLLASASRMSWSFARDRGLPGWRLLQRVDPRTSVPVWAIAVTTLIACLLSIINIGSEVAFNDAISLTVASLNSSYLMASGLLLYRRCRGDIKSLSDLDSGVYSDLTNTAGSPLTWGPWHIPGAFGIFVNAVACMYMVVILFFSFWPPATPVTAATMNFSSLVTGAVVVFGVVYYAVWGRKVYTGPVIEIEQKSRGNSFR